ncbi:hypothetical protein [Pseudomonas syringae group genomosp. 3]|uniref:hypothetical protein n=1 Tax=Pseudomonas syringae group genomosp. 3 TaxID=251701 RepID=UPI0006B8EB82|nr:hypothetical protein [Pseudomonas syringae group genomosp. 3]KPB82014.1 Unknown protein sequence [Pseudomonas syringae pv. maculicola]
MNRSSTLLSWKHRWALKLMMQDSRNRLPRGFAPVRVVIEEPARFKGGYRPFTGPVIYLKAAGTGKGKPSSDHKD